MISEAELLELYDDGVLYDLENAPQEDVIFWKSVAGDPKVTSFLELCCGTGRIGMELLPELQRYHGVDISKSFLDRFRSKRDKTEIADICVDFELYREDIGKIRTGMTYDVIAIPFNSFIHFYSFDDINNALQTVKKHMTPESVFVFDIHNPGLEFLVKRADETCTAKVFTDTVTATRLMLLNQADMTRQHK